MSRHPRLAPERPSPDDVARFRERTKLILARMLKFFRRAPEPTTFHRCLALHISGADWRNQPSRPVDEFKVKP